MLSNKRFQEFVEQFENAKDNKNKSLNMHYFLIKNDKKIYLHRFNNRTEKSDIRSISKTVMTIVTGIVNRLSEEGKYSKFDEETYIYPVIKDVIHLTNKENEKQLKKIKVKHLLTHTIGFNDVLLMRDDIKNMDPFTYLDYIVNYPIIHEPGEYYLYSNAGFYLLSAFLQEFLKEDLLMFINRELFQPLNIRDFRWEKYGDYLAGATRLWLFPEDLLKIGELLLNEGTYNKKRFFNKDWLKKMQTFRFRTKDVDTPEAIFRRYGYGYGIWLAKEDFYFGHGTDGQTLIILPKHNYIILTQAYQHDVEKLEMILDNIITDILYKK